MNSCLRQPSGTRCAILDLDERVVAREHPQLRLAILHDKLGKSEPEPVDVLGTSRSNVSQLERSEDPHPSSIARYVHALGGQLHVNAVVGTTTYRLLDEVDENEVASS